MTHRQAAEALYQQVCINKSGGSDGQERAIQLIEAAFKAQRAEEIACIEGHFEKENKNGVRMVYLDDLLNWLDARAREWRG